MKLPAVIHPKTILLDGFKFKVVAYCALTDQQAGKIVLHYCRTHKLKKKDQKIVRTIVTQFDTDSIGLL